MELTDAEKRIIAEFICDRYDILMEIADDPKIPSKDFREGARKDAKTLEVLNNKFRPWAKKGK